MSAVLVFLPDGRALGFATADELRDAIALGAHLSKPMVPNTDMVNEEPLLDADGLARALNIPVNWIEEGAREGRIPFYRAGRWVRYRRSEVEEKLRADARAAIKGTKK